jgi:hypothetical protein
VEEKAAMLGAMCDSYINHKKLESARGFLVYVANTFKAMTPYLKGIHLTLDSWREHRDHDGWKIPFSLREKLEVKEDVKQGGLPLLVKGVAQIMDDIGVLMDFTAADIPPLVPARPSQSLAMFIVGGASGRVLEGRPGSLGTWVFKLHSERGTQK